MGRLAGVCQHLLSGAALLWAGLRGVCQHLLSGAAQWRRAGLRLTQSVMWRRVGWRGFAGPTRATQASQPHARSLTRSRSRCLNTIAPRAFSTRWIKMKM